MAGGFKSLINARRIASIPRNIEQKFNSLTFSTATKDVIIHLIELVRQTCGDKVAKSLAEEIPLEPKTEVELYRLRNIVSIAKGFLHYRELMKRRISKLAEEQFELRNTTFTVQIRLKEATSTPWRTSVVYDGLLFNEEDLEKINLVKRRVRELDSEISRIKSEYFIS